MVDEELSENTKSSISSISCVVEGQMAKVVGDGEGSNWVLVGHFCRFDRFMRRVFFTFFFFFSMGKRMNMQ